MRELERWWSNRSHGEKVAMGVVGALAILAVGGALAYAIATGGVIIASGETLILIGAATSMIRGRV